MVSTRRSGSLSNKNGKSSSSPEDLQSPQRRKLQNGTTSRAVENSKKLNPLVKVFKEVANDSKSNVARRVPKAKAKVEAKGISLKLGSVKKMSSMTSGMQTQSTVLNAPPCRLFPQNTMLNYPWCRLLPQRKNIPALAFFKTYNVLGAAVNADFFLPSSSFDGICVIKLIQRESRVVAELEWKEGNDALLINGKCILKNAIVKLNSGDELVFGHLFGCSYIFHQLLCYIDAKTPSANSRPYQSPELSSSLKIDFLEGNLKINDGSCSDALTITGSNIPPEGGIDTLNTTEERDRNRYSMILPSKMSTIDSVFKELIQKEILEGCDIKVSFDDFPYYLSEKTKNLLIEASYIHLKHGKQLKSNSVLSTTNSRILLHGPARSEIYQETLAKALAKYYGVKLLIFDRHSMMAGLSANVAELEMEIKTMRSHNGTSNNPLFKIGDRVRFIGSFDSSSLNATSYPSSTTSESASTIKGPVYGERGTVVLPFENNSVSKIGVSFDKPVPDGVDFSGLCVSDHGYFCNAKELCLESTIEEDLYKLLIPTLFEVVFKESWSSPFILFLTDVDTSILENVELFAIFNSRLEQLPKNVIVIGSQTHADNYKEKMQHKGKDVVTTNNILPQLFPNKVNIHIPQDNSLLVRWKQQLDQDSETIKMKRNRNFLRTVIFRYGLECDVLETLCIKEESLTKESAEKVVKWALNHSLIQNSEDYPNAKHMLSSDSIQYGIGVLRSFQNESNSLKKSMKAVVTVNELEKKLLDEVILPNDIGVTFKDIGGLENIKKILKEMVILPLQRPELFCKALLTEPCKGILLYGSPGTGKTMLAKAVAAEAGANIINISLSSITSKWFAWGEKYVKEVFNLARKIAPTIVLVEEVDHILGRMDGLMCKIKNEFMVCWDGLPTNNRDRVVVLAVTNRPFDLDDVVVKRFSRRLLVNLPDAINRETILKLILQNVDFLKDIDFVSVANMTAGYSGSDLKNLCVTAAQYRIRELLEKEKIEHSTTQEDGKLTSALSSSADIRPLNMDDFRNAHEQVCANLATGFELIRELRQWTELYGEPGFRREKAPSYFM